MTRLVAAILLHMTTVSLSGVQCSNDLRQSASLDEVLQELRAVTRGQPSATSWTTTQQRRADRPRSSSQSISPSNRKCSFCQSFSSSLAKHHMLTGHETNHIICMRHHCLKALYCSDTNHSISRSTPYCQTELSATCTSRKRTTGHHNTMTNKAAAGQDPAC
jgi:hypothetical protein